MGTMILMSFISDRENVNTKNTGLRMNTLCEWWDLETHNKSGPITVNSTGVWLWALYYNFDTIFYEIKGNQLGTSIIRKVLLK